MKLHSIIAVTALLSGFGATGYAFTAGDDQGDAAPADEPVAAAQGALVPKHGFCLQLQSPSVLTQCFATGDTSAWDIKGPIDVSSIIWLGDATYAEISIMSSTAPGAADTYALERPLTPVKLQVQLQSSGQAYTMISNIMKTRHETVKSIISNIR